MLNYYRARSRAPRRPRRTDGRVKGVPVLLIWVSPERRLHPAQHPARS